MKNSIVFISLVTVFVFLACGKDEQASGPSIFNTWEEIEPVGILQYGGSTYQSLYILDDSTFQLKYKEWTDVINVGDPCSPISTYFVKGTCTTASDVITFNGCFTDSTYNQCIPNCAGTIDFSSDYKYKVTADSLILNPGEYWTNQRDMIPQ